MLVVCLSLFVVRDSPMSPFEFSLQKLGSPCVYIDRYLQIIYWTAYAALYSPIVYFLHSVYTVLHSVYTVFSSVRASR